MSRNVNDSDVMRAIHITLEDIGVEVDFLDVDTHVDGNNGTMTISWKNEEA